MSSNNVNNIDLEKELTKLKINQKILEQQVTTLKEDKLKLQGELAKIQKEQIEYLQNVSHQLVAPLNAMKWHIENLTEGRYRDIDRINKVLRSVYSQATILVHLSKNFALMSNLSADHTLSTMTEPTEPIHLCRLLVNLADDFQPLGWDKDIHISVIDDPLDKAPDVIVIKNLVSQVFSNIIENGVKYSSPNSEIRISGKYDAPSKCVVVEISNTGIPLPDSDFDRIFERGYRTQKAKDAYPAGTGFGLFIAKKIIDIHNGTIKAFTDKSGKTVFSVALKTNPVANVK